MLEAIEGGDSKGKARLGAGPQRHQQHPVRDLRGGEVTHSRGAIGVC